MITINGKPLEIKTWGGGERHPVVMHEFIEGQDTEISMLFQGSDDIVDLILIDDSLREQRLEWSLVISYMPFSRQDRVCTRGEPLSIRAFARVINNLSHNVLITTDIHNEASLALFRDCLHRSQLDLFSDFLCDLYLIIQDTVLIAPDAGAYKKVLAISEHNKQMVVTLNKVRTKEGIAYDIEQQVPVQGQDCTIIDDICDGGRTFIEAAKILRLNGAGKITLWVTHGIFCRGLEPLLEHLDAVWCVNLLNSKIKRTKTIQCTWHKFTKEDL